MPTKLPDEMKIACCNICLLADAMKDCTNCPFKIGLTVKNNDAYASNIVSTKENIKP